MHGTALNPTSLVKELNALLSKNWDTIEAASETRPNKRKYLELNDWVSRMCNDAAFMGLDRASPLRILDIGTGPGYFPFICRKLGHKCLALDKPGYPFYERLCLRGWHGGILSPDTSGTAASILSNEVRSCHDYAFAMEHHQAGETLVHCRGVGVFPRRLEGQRPYSQRLILHKDE